MVERGERANRVDGALNVLVPTLGSATLQRFIAEQILIGVSGAKAVMRQLEVWRDAPVLEQRRAEARAECDHGLDALAENRAKSLNVGVVRHTRGAAEPGGERSS